MTTAKDVSELSSEEFNEIISNLSIEQIVENVSINYKTITDAWMEIVASKDKIIEDLKDRIKELSE